MREAAQEGKRDWVKVGPCLYRYRGKAYYALFKVGGKQIRRSLETTDLELARRRLRQLRGELENSTAARSKLTLDEMAARYLETVRDRPSTVKHKQNAIRLLLADWSQDAPRELFKIRRSHIGKWIASYKGKAAAAVNDYIASVRSMFDQAIDDGELAVSPTLGVKYWKREKPIRLTPTYVQFQAITADLRHPDRHNPRGQEETANFVEFAGEGMWTVGYYYCAPMLTFMQTFRENFGILDAIRPEFISTEQFAKCLGTKMRISLGTKAFISAWERSDDATRAKITNFLGGRNSIEELRRTLPLCLKLDRIHKLVVRRRRATSFR